MQAYTRTRRRSRVAATIAALAALCSAAALAACGEDEASGGGGSGDTIEVLAFSAPSLGAFLPAVIEERGIDEKHGVNLEFSYTTPDNYNSEFAAGHADVGASAAVLSEALRSERGSKTSYLFNLFDFFGAVVTSDDAIRSLPDLSGRSLAAATGTTNYAMFQWFAEKQGLDLGGVKELNQTTAGLSTMALSGRADATQLWEPAYSSLLEQKPDLRTLDLGIERWQEEFGTDEIPYLGVAARPEWAERNPKLVKALYETYREAAEWSQANPEEAASVIAAEIPNGNADVIRELIEENDQLQLNVKPAGEMKRGLEAVVEAGRETGYLKKAAADELVYEGL